MEQHISPEEQELLADAQSFASQEQLNDVGSLIELQLALETDVDKKTQELTELKTKLRKVQEDLLPTAILSAGLGTVKTKDGLKVDIKEDLTISVPKIRKAEIAEWLRSNGDQDIIENTTTVDLNNVGDNVRNDAIAYLEAHGIPVTQDETFNTAKLKKILRDRQREGQTLDLKFFGAYNWRKAIISQ